MTHRIVTLWNDTEHDIEMPSCDVDGEIITDIAQAGRGLDTTGEHYDEIKEWVAKSGLRVEVLEIEDDGA